MLLLSRRLDPVLSATMVATEAQVVSLVCVRDLHPKLSRLRMRKPAKPAMVE